MPILQFPPGVVFEEGPILADGFDAAPEEVEHAARFAEKRRREFLTGRTLARRALRRLGSATPAILPDAKRCPLWPEGLIGSITHSGAYCAVAVARKSVHAGLGLDIQNLAAVKESFRAKVMVPEELAAWEALPAGDAPEGRLCRLGLVFSAKEAFYKLQYPLTAKWLGFQQVDVEFVTGSEFVLRLRVDAGPGFRSGDAFRGLYAIADHRAAAFMSLPAAAGAISEPAS